MGPLIQQRDATRMQQAARAEDASSGSVVNAAQSCDASLTCNEEKAPSKKTLAVLWSRSHLL